MTAVRRCIAPGGGRRVGASSRTVGLLALALVAAPLPAQGQIAELLRIVNNGGSWINLDIESGSGSFESPVFPVAGLALDGCFQLWEGHSGSWTVRVEDTLGDDKLNVTAAPGERVKFRYKAGLQAQLDVEIEWSEPRDTTLFMWVGLSALAGKETSRDICQPPPS